MLQHSHIYYEVARAPDPVPFMFLLRLREFPVIMRGDANIGLRASVTT